MIPGIVDTLFSCETHILNRQIIGNVSRCHYICATNDLILTSFSFSGGGKVIGLEQRQLIGSKLIGQELLSLSLKTKSKEVCIIH